MFFWLSCIAAGTAFCALVWVLVQPAITHAGKGDVHLPKHFLLRLAWPWMLALAALCGPFLSWRLRQVLARRIQAAGLPSIWRPEHVVALQVAAFATLAGAVGWQLGMFEGSGSARTMLLTLAGGLPGIWLPLHVLMEKKRNRQEHMLRELPFLLDMATLCVEAGLNLQGALQQAALHGPPGPLRTELRHALADMRAGMPRAQALDGMAARSGLSVLATLAGALKQADQTGMSLGPLLRAQADQRRSERFVRAEQRALEAPVKMLFPMVFCIFPCTFLIIGFPIAAQLLAIEL